MDCIGEGVEFLAKAVAFLFGAAVGFAVAIACAWFDHWTAAAWCAGLGLAAGYTLQRLLARLF